MSTEAIAVLRTTPNTPAIEQLLAESDAYLDQLYPPESQHAASLTALQPPDVTFWIAQDTMTEQLLGCVALKATGSGYGELKRLYVRPAARGQGIASRLLTVVMADAPAFKIHTVQLETGTLQPEAIALYEKLGFKQIGPFGSYGLDPYSVYYQKVLESSVCPVCQTAIPWGHDRLCPACDWPLRSPELSTEQLLWVRQQWQQTANFQHIATQLAQIQVILEPDAPGATEPDRSVPVEIPTVDETLLRESLEQQQWQEADQLSAQYLLAIAGREQQGYLTPDDLATLSLDALHHIDHLWRTASEGHFGLTVQKQCHIDLCGNRSRITKMWPQLGVQLGWCNAENRWRTYEQLNFSLDAPLGHLPVLGDGRVWFVGGWSGAFAGFTALMSRL